MLMEKPPIVQAKLSCLGLVARVIASECNRGRINVAPAQIFAIKLDLMRWESATNVSLLEPAPEASQIIYSFLFEQDSDLYWHQDTIELSPAMKTYNQAH